MARVGWNTDTFISISEKLVEYVIFKVRDNGLLVVGRAIALPPPTRGRRSLLHHLSLLSKPSDQLSKLTENESFEVNQL